MKITLINPGKFSTYQPPLSLAYITSYLNKYSDKKHSIQIIDENAEELIENEIPKNEPDIIGITATTPQITGANRIATFIKKNYPEIPIILGGVHVSSIPKQTLKEFEKFDIGVMGEGELTFLELINLYSKNNFIPETLKDVKGIVFRNNEKPIITTPRPLIENLDTIPFPARHLLKMREYYLKLRGVVRGIPKRATQIMTSRGCPYNCNFCASHVIHKNRFRAYSPQYVIKEIEYLIGEYKIKALFFQDDTFLINKKLVEKICKMMVEKGINEKLKWSVQLRADLISDTDINLLRLMKDAGCVQAEFGFESGNERVLSLLKKNSVTVKQNSDAIKLCKKIGFRVLGNFMIGAPTETIEEINDTKNFIITHANMLDYVSLHLTTPYPGTELWEICKQKKLLKGLSWSDFWMGQVDKGVVICSDTIGQEKMLQIFKEMKLSTLLQTNKIVLLKKFFKNPKNFLKWIIIFYPAFKNKFKNRFSRILPR